MLDCQSSHLSALEFSLLAPGVGINRSGWHQGASLGGQGKKESLSKTYCICLHLELPQLCS